MSKVDLAKLEKQIYEKRKEVKYDMRDLTVEYICDKYENGIPYSQTDEEQRPSLKIKRNIIFIPEYQREFTWDERRSSKLIESILLGLPIPFIFVAENPDGAWEIVDGSQRIRAIHAFVKNDLQLVGLESLDYANNLYFDDFEKSRQGKFLDTALRFILLSEETSDDVKKDMFERINRGSDLLKAMEKRKGIYTGRFTSFIYDYVDTSEKFQSLVQVDRWLERRQERQELLLRFFALSENNAYEYGISGGLADFLDKYLEKKNEELSKLDDASAQREIEKYRKKIDDVNDCVEKYFPFGYRHKQNPQTKRSVFEAISIGVLKALESGKEIKELSRQEIIENIDKEDFKKNTHVANQLHKKQKLSARVNFICNMLLGI